ncbi:MAG: hypothetical protein HEQ23_03815 [Tepidisphaera sp.]
MGLSDVIQHIGTFLAAAQTLPLGVHLLVGAGFVAGMILWLAGGRVVQPAFVVLGSLGGAWIGAMVVPGVVNTATIFGLPSVYAGLAGGLIAGLIISLVAFKIAMGVSAAVVFAAIGIVGATITLARTPGALPEPSETQKTIAALRSSLSESAAKIREELRANKSDAAERVHEYAEEVRLDLKGRWEALPVQSRKMLMLSAAGGFILGLLLGLAAPKKCAALVTAMLGGGAVIVCGYWLLNAMNPELASKVQMGAIGIAITWAAVTIVGVLVQWQGGAKVPAKAAAPAAPAA